MMALVRDRTLASPPETETPAMEGHAHTDASRLSFPLQLVILIVSTVVAAGGSVWVSQAGLKSDVRNIVTTMEAQERVQAIQAKLQDERLTSLREQMLSFQRRQELQQYELQGLKEVIIKLQNQGTR
jgi:hypothetical protein